MPKSKNNPKEKNGTGSTRTPRPISAKEKLSVEVKSLSSQIAMLTNIMIENRNDEKVKSSRDPELQEIKKLLSRNQSELDSLLSEKRSEEKEQKNIELEKLTTYTDAAEESYKNGNLVSGLILSFLSRNEKSKEKIKQEQEIERNKRIDELKEQNKKLSDQKKILLNLDQNIVQSNETFTNSVQDSEYVKRDSDDISKNILSETQKTNSLLSNILRVTVVDFEDTALEKLSKVIKESIPPPSSDNNFERRQQRRTQPRNSPNRPPIPPGNPNKIPTFRQLPGGLPMSPGALAAGAAISIGLGYGFYKGLNAEQEAYDERRKKEQESKVEKAQRETANEDAKIKQKIKSQADEAISMYGDKAKTPEYAEAAAEQRTGKEKAAWLEIARERRTNPVATPAPAAEAPPAGGVSSTPPSPNGSTNSQSNTTPSIESPKRGPFQSLSYDTASPSKIIIEGPVIIQLSKLQRKLFSEDLAAGIRKASSDSGELDALSDNIEDLSEKIEDPSIFSKISFSPSISSPYKPAGDKPTGSGTGEKDKTKESGSGTGGETESKKMESAAQPQSTNVTPTSPTRVKDLKTQEIEAIQQLIQTESGGENIINKKTYDAGYFQFSPSTAWELMGRPDIQGVTKGTRGYSFSEDAKKEISRRVLDKSKDEQFSMYQKYIEPLKKANIPITFENIKTYGFASSSGLSALKSQDPNSVIYSPQWVNDKRDKKGFQHFGEMADLSDAGGAITLKGMQEWSTKMKPQKLSQKVLEIVPNAPSNTSTTPTNDTNRNTIRNQTSTKPQMLTSNNESGAKTYTNAATAADIDRRFASYDASSLNYNINNNQIISGQNGESSRKRPDDPFNHLINRFILNT